MQTKPLILALLAGITISGTVQAALHDRGGGLIYDDVLKVTWLADANYAKTSGQHSTGIMLGDVAAAWAANLSYYDNVRNTTWNDWRLPTVSPVNGNAFNYDDSPDGSTDVGYNISAAGTLYPGSTASELAYMYYQNLGNTGGQTIQGGNTNCYVNTASCLDNVGPFLNLQANLYWTETAYQEPDTSNHVWFLRMRDGYQDGTIWYDPDGGYAWAVRDGDVAAVPEPETYALLLAGLGLVGFVARRRKQQVA